MGMYAYMTEIERVDNLSSEEIRAEGHDMISLLFAFLDEFLFIFNAEPNFIARVSFVQNKGLRLFYWIYKEFRSV